MKLRSLVLAGVVASGCTVESPLSPSSDPLTFPVRVRVLTQATEQPIGGASVWLGRTLACRTDASTGECVASVPGQGEVCIEVTADGFQPSVSACGEVRGSSERWTFYLWQ